MAWFRRAVKPEVTAASTEQVPEDGGTEPVGGPVATDTVGNPIIERRHGRHAAETPPEEPVELPSRAEHRMLQFVAEGRVARTSTGGAAGAFWRVDGAFATGTKAMMLDWLLEQGYITEGRPGRVAVETVLTAPGLAVLHRA